VAYAVVGAVTLAIGVAIGVRVNRAETPHGPALNVMVLGDWGRRGEHGQGAVAAAMGRVADRVPPEFVISTGDNFYPSGLRGPGDALNFRGSFTGVYTAPSLQAPWHAVLGNHDYGDGDHAGEPEGVACALYEGTCRGVGTADECCYSMAHQLLPAWRDVDPRWHAYRSATLAPEAMRGEVEFFLYDTSPVVAADEYAEDPWYDGSGPDSLSRQSGALSLAELDARLAASRARWKVVVGHHPVYSRAGHGDTPALVKGVEPMLRKHGVALYMNGHDHAMQFLTKDGVAYLTSGAGSKLGEVTGEAPAEGSGQYAAAENGFALLQISDREGIRVEIYGVEDDSPVFVSVLRAPPAPAGA